MEADGAGKREQDAHMKVTFKLSFFGVLAPF